MKKLFATTLILLSIIAFSFAQQTVASDFYLMKNTHDAELVLKAINNELKLSETTFAQVRDLLFASAKSQAEQITPTIETERINIIKTRQTVHIENQLKTILGLDKFNIYQQKKAAMDTKLKELKKN